jgi:hypothetical protein
VISLVRKRLPNSLSVFHLALKATGQPKLADLLGAALTETKQLPNVSILQTLRRDEANQDSDNKVTAIEHQKNEFFRLATNVNNNLFLF